MSRTNTDELDARRARHKENRRSRSKDRLKTAPGQNIRLDWTVSSHAFFVGYGSGIWPGRERVGEGGGRPRIR